MADTDKLVEELSGLTVLEVADLVKSLEDKWGVSAAAPAAVAVAGGGEAAAEEEKTEFDVVLTSFGENKIAVIKEVRGTIDARPISHLFRRHPCRLRRGVCSCRLATYPS